MPQLEKRCLLEAQVTCRLCALVLPFKKPGFHCEGYGKNKR